MSPTIEERGKPAFLTAIISRGQIHIEGLILHLIIPVLALVNYKTLAPASTGAASSKDGGSRQARIYQQAASWPTTSCKLRATSACRQIHPRLHLPVQPS